MPFTKADAEAMRLRLQLGWSRVDDTGNEIPVPPKRRVPATGTVPTADELFERYKNSGEVQGDARQWIERLRAIAGKTVTAPQAMEPIDLTPFAKGARMSVAQILAQPDPPRRQDVRDATPRAARLLSAARVPARFVELIMAGGLRDTPPLVDVRAWLATPNRWGIVLSGNRGTGKTAAACVAIVESGGGLFLTAEDIAMPEGKDLLDEAEAAPMLVLDEMGDEALTDFGSARLRSLVGSRHKNNRRTVCTTNLSLPEWGARYGARAVDWLREGGGFKLYSGESLRGAK